MNDLPFAALGIDVGGTKTAVGVVHFPSGEVVTEKSIATRPERDGKAVLQDIATLVETVAAEARQAGEVISGVGVGICELVSPGGQVLSHNCLAWDKDQVQRCLASLGPVTLEADVRAAALAESLFGAGQQFTIFLYVTVGTGIACCLCLEGVPDLGARGATGTMASSPLSWACERCGHLNGQTLEQIASGPGLVQRYNRLQPGRVHTGQEILAAAASGDLDALRVVDTAGEALESTVALLVNVLDPQAVIIGGGLGLSEGPFWAGFIAATRKHIWSEVHRDLPILRAATGLRAGMIGAAAAAWKAQNPGVRPPSATS